MANRKKKQRTKKKGRDRSASTIEQHRRYRKKLVPPLLDLPAMKPASWLDDQLPEMLWACLVVSTLPRDHALSAFGRIGSIGLAHRDAEGTGSWSLRHSDIAEYRPELISDIVEVVTSHPLGYAALRPLVLLDLKPA